jgi:hypothetical protein
VIAGNDQLQICRDVPQLMQRSLKLLDFRFLGEVTAVDDNIDWFRDWL